MAHLLATWFYLGHLKAPGTWGTLGALAVAWLLHTFAGFGAGQFGVLALISIFPAIWASDQVVLATGKKDPQIVVIDEVVGLWFTLIGATTLNWKSWLGAFLLFRLFDILKPPPIRSFEALPGGTGIVADDVAAGLLAALVLFAAGWFNFY